MACQEMELYYAYLDALEEQKRKAQPWQCEVTVMPSDASDDEARVPAAPVTKPATKPAPAAKPGFVCDDPE
jgi:hypothetical protein